MNNNFGNILQEIINYIESNSKVLDLGCGNGALLAELIKEKHVIGIGVDNNSYKVRACIKKGISVIHQDMEKILHGYPDKSYDYIILSQTLQAVKKPDFVLKEIIRIGKKVIVSFPNFAYHKLRLQITLEGHMPKSNVLPHEWYNTPNIHLLTIKDFEQYCKKNNIVILKKCFYKNQSKSKYKLKVLANIFAEEALFIIKG